MLVPFLCRGKQFWEAGEKRFDSGGSKNVGVEIENSKNSMEVGEM